MYLDRDGLLAARQVLADHTFDLFILLVAHQPVDRVCQLWDRKIKLGNSSQRSWLLQWFKCFKVFKIPNKLP